MTDEESIHEMLVDLTDELKLRINMELMSFMTRQEELEADSIKPGHLAYPLFNAITHSYAETIEAGILENIQETGELDAASMIHFCAMMMHSVALTSYKLGQEGFEVFEAPCEGHGDE
jgi:hypothetical protein